MCILSFIPANAEISSDVEIDLYNGGVSNPDGHGWAIASDNGLMVVGKSLNLDEALEGLSKARTTHSGPALFHSRWATHGSIRLGNCHPFFVGNSHKTVVAHNGILPAAAHPAASDDRSDTALFAEDIMPRQWRRLARATVRQSMADWIGRSNKLVILTVDTRYGATNQGWIINEDLGIWDEPTGVWHSNSDYRYGWSGRSVTIGSLASKYTVKDWSGDSLTDVDPTECVYCDHRVNHFGICTFCSTCQDCLEPSDECQCWQGSASLRDLTEALDPNMPIPFLPVED